VTTKLLPALALVTATALPRAAPAEVQLEAEGGIGFAGYNDVRIPGDVGTAFSFTDDLDTGSSLFGRVRATWSIGRHQLSGLVAPLRFDADGALDRPLRFADETFAVGAPLDGRYQFDTYRLSYTYRFVDRPTLRLAGGATALLRVAEIRIRSGAQAADKENVGLVPLLRLVGDWRPLSWLGFGVEAEGLASPQGRAFDVAAALLFPFAERFTGRVGYRFIEGGADNDEVYNFALLGLPFVGLSVEL
jgi:hypothetical protein